MSFLNTDPINTRDTLDQIIKMAKLIEADNFVREKMAKLEGGEKWDLPPDRVGEAHIVASQELDGEAVT